MPATKDKIRKSARSQEGQEGPPHHTVGDLAGKRHAAHIGSYTSQARSDTHPSTPGCTVSCYTTAETRQRKSTPKTTASVVGEQKRI